MSSLLILLLGRTPLLLFLLLLMDSSTSSPTPLHQLPPRIPYLEILDSGQSAQLYTNQSFVYSPASFEAFEIRCRSEERADPVRQDIFYI
jgi:hypothetical protein